MEKIEGLNEEMEAELDKEAMAYQGMGIKLLAISGGLLGSLFVLGWIFAFLSGFSVASIVVGIATLAAAIVVDKKAESTVVDTACIGAYMAGCFMIGFGVDKALASDNITTLVILIIAVAVPFLTKGYMLNFIAVLMFSGALFSFININNAYDLIHVLLVLITLGYAIFCLYESELLSASWKVNVVYNSWRNGLLCSFLFLLAYMAVDRVIGKHLQYEWISSVAIIGIYLFFLKRMINYLGIEEKKTQGLIYCGSLLIMLMAVFSPAICGALLILLISFHTGHRLGLILSIISLVYFTGQFYYNLHYTLLIKSMMMFGTGIMFLTAWYILRKTLKRYEQD